MVAGLSTVRESLAGPTSTCNMHISHPAHKAPLASAHPDPSLIRKPKRTNLSAPQAADDPGGPEREQLLSKARGQLFKARELDKHEQLVLLGYGQLDVVRGELKLAKVLIIVWSVCWPAAKSDTTADVSHQGTACDEIQPC